MSAVADPLIDATAIIDRRDAIWKRLTPQERVQLAELSALRDANEAVETVLASDTFAPYPNLRRVEEMRCTVCRGFITRCELEIRRDLFKGNSAVVSAAENFIRRQREWATADTPPTHLDCVGGENGKAAVETIQPSA